MKHNVDFDDDNIYKYVQLIYSRRFVLPYIVHRPSELSLSRLTAIGSKPFQLSNDFRRYFRISTLQFDTLLDRIEPEIAKVRTNWRQPISPAERLAAKPSLVLACPCTFVKPNNIKFRAGEHIQSASLQTPP